MKAHWTSIFALLLLCGPSALLSGQSAIRTGTVVRMKMVDCVGPQHHFLAAMSGSAPVPTGELCPQYVLVADKVVYLIMGRKSDQLLPLADETRFRLQNNELLIRIDDARRESHFRVMEMMLRPEWDSHPWLQEQPEGALPRPQPNAAAITNVQ